MNERFVMPFTSRIIFFLLFFMLQHNILCFMEWKIRKERNFNFFLSLFSFRLFCDLQFFLLNFVRDSVNKHHFLIASFRSFAFDLRQKMDKVRDVSSFHLLHRPIPHRDFQYPMMICAAKTLALQNLIVFYLDLNRDSRGKRNENNKRIK